jgi:hypothetical protein
MLGLTLYLPANDSRIRTQVGSKHEEGIVIRDCPDGSAIYGPYIDLPRGQYKASVDFAEDKSAFGKAVVDICWDLGKKNIKSLDFDLSHIMRGQRRVCIEFVLENAVSQLEVRLLCAAGCWVTITGIEILFCDLDASRIETIVNSRLGDRLLKPDDSSENHERSVFGGAQYYDIVRIRRRRPVGGIALVFFMGLGDYLMATPIIEAVRLAHPDLPLYGYASSHDDSVNSPLLVHLLRSNPAFHSVFTYKGRPAGIWTSYDFHDALKDIPDDFLVLPVIFETSPEIFHRVTTLAETFGLEVKLPVARPILPITALSTRAAAILQDVRQRAAVDPVRGVVFCHSGARSSGYEYPHSADLVRRIASAGYLVVALSPVEIEDDRVVAVDVTTIAPTDTIEILRQLQQDVAPLFIVSVNSVMWPISAGLGIRNLGLHIFQDDGLHQYLYPNIFVVTQHFYERVSPSRYFLAPKGTFETRESKTGVQFADYAPGFVMDCFLQMVDEL